MILSFVSDTTMSFLDSTIKDLFHSVIFLSAIRLRLMGLV